MRWGSASAAFGYFFGNGNATGWTLRAVLVEQPARGLRRKIGCACKDRASGFFALRDARKTGAHRRLAKRRFLSRRIADEAVEFCRSEVALRHVIRRSTHNPSGWR